MQPGHRPRRRPTTQKVGIHAPQEEGLRLHQAADPGRRRPRPRRPSARPSASTASTSWSSSRRTTPRRSPSAATSSRSRSRSTRTARSPSSPRRPPAAELIKKAAGVRQGLRRAAQDEGRQALARPGPRDRPPEDGRPQRQRRGDGGAHHRRHRSLDGHRHPALSTTAPLGARPRVRAGASGSRPGGIRHAVGQWEGQRWPAPRLHRTNQGAAMKRSKNYRAAAELDHARQGLRPPRGRPRRQADRQGQVRRDRRGRLPPRRRPAQGRPGRPRHGQPAARHGQDRPRPRLRQRRQGRGRS